MFAGDVGDGATGFVGVEIGDVGIGGGKIHGVWGTELVSFEFHPPIGSDDRCLFFCR